MQFVVGKNPNGEKLVVVIGGATKDAESKTFDSGKTKVQFSLGVGKRADGSSIYADCEAWGRVGEQAKDIHKGDVVFAAGSVRSHEYNGKTYTSVNCEIVINASATLNNANVPASAGDTNDSPKENAETDFEEIGEDDALPF